MKNHKFIQKTGTTYKVQCKKTGGDFNTKLWKQGKIKKQQCPCCEQEIKK